MKRKLLIGLLLVFLSFGVVACKEETKKTSLSTPTNLVVENQYITFDEVDNASYYLINYDGNTFVVKPSGTGEIVFDAKSIFNEIKTYEVKVKAIGAGDYLDSRYTAVVRYTREKIYSAPEVELTGQVLSWTPVEDVTLYTVRVEYPNGSSGVYTYSDTVFDIKPVLTSVGYYKFQVKVGQDDDANEYSVAHNYLCEKQFNTPSNLSFGYNKNEGEVYLYFVADEDSYGYTINVNGNDYILTEPYLTRYLEKSGYENLNKVKLTSFLKSQNVDTDVLSSYYVSVASKSASSDYYIDSDKSIKSLFEIKSVMSTTKLSLQKNNNGGILSWNKVDDASAYIVYKNLQHFIRLDKDSLSLTVSKEELEGNSFNVQVVGQNGVLSSVLSNAVSDLDMLEKPSLSFDGNKISWGELDAKTILLEIYNDNTMTAMEFNGDSTGFELSSRVDYAKYNINLIYINSDNQISQTASISINYTKKLGEPQSITVGNEYSRYVVSFEKVENAVGYAVKLNNNELGILYTSNAIDLTEYISESGRYNLKVKAVALVNSNITDSDWVEVGEIQHTTKLARPYIEMVCSDEDGKYSLKIKEVENAVRYNILINYISYDGSVDSIDNGYLIYDLSDYLVNAQNYNIMVQAVASETNIVYVSSDYASVVVPRHVQLDTINSDKITITNIDSKYMIEFTTQTYAANYNLKFVNLLTEKEQTVKISYVPYDISQYVKEKGNYQIYVTALAQEGSFYLDAKSGNAYVLEKDKDTLAQVGNIKVDEKQNTTSDLFLRWDTVNNAEGYYLYMYYQQTDATKQVLINELVLTQNKLNLDDYLSLEGKYIFKIKAISSGEYESSSIAETSYKYLMTNKYDFLRNKVFMNGENYSHYITSYSQLKHVMWYYYLFNNIEYYSTDVYRAKIMLGVDVATLEEQCKTENPTFEVDDAESEVERLHAVVSLALSSYDGDFYLAKNSFNLPRAISTNEGSIVYYEYNFVSGLAMDKTDVIEKTDSSLMFKQKNNTLAEILQRKGDVFKIDAKEKMDVTSTEQLFMAVQYDKSPNFVGDCAVAQSVYANCREVLNSIISASMTDYEKVVAIYKWLVANVEYNDEFVQLMTKQTNCNDTVSLTSNILMGNCKYNYLEGVFYDSSNRSATANGFAKAFVLMCKIEGIDAIKINGTKGGYAHYWNKVYIDATPNNDKDDSAWFSVDIASGFRDAEIDSIKYFIASYSYFLVTDAQLMNIGLTELASAKNVQSVTSVNFYNNEQFSYKKQMFNSEAQKITYSGSGTLQYNSDVNLADYIKDVIKYMVVECQKNDKNYAATELVEAYAIELDMSNLKTSLDSVVSSISSGYYTDISAEWKCSFKIYAETYDNKILITIMP